jgi:hypothetical protein
VRSDDKEDFDFLIAAPFAEKVTHKVAQLIREGKKFAVLIAVDLLPQIRVTKTKEDDELVQQCLLSIPPFSSRLLPWYGWWTTPIIDFQSKVM